MTKEKLRIKTRSIRVVEHEKATRPMKGYKLLKERRTLFGKYILIFEKTYTNG